jgi:hypothetical protein
MIVVVAFRPQQSKMAAPDMFRRHGIVSAAIGFIDWYHTSDVMGATPFGFDFHYCRCA